MRNTLIILSSLALAASSQAVEFATATSQVDVGYTLGANMSVAYNAVSVNLPSRSAGMWIHNIFTDGDTAPQVFDFDSGAPVDPSHYTASLSGNGSGSVFGNRLVLTSTASGAFSGNQGDSVSFRRYGYRYFLQVTNNELNAQAITFDFNLQRRSASGTVDVPVDLANNLGQYAESGGSADIIDTSIADDPTDYDVFGDTYTSASGKDYSLEYTFPTGGFRTFMVPGRDLVTGVGGSIELEVYTSSYVFLEDDLRAVPEPASLAALGLGALGLLRRRRGGRA